MISFTLNLQALTFKAFPLLDDEGGIYFSARTCIHIGCMDKELLEWFETREVSWPFMLNNVKFRITSKGYDMGWDTTCPVCTRNVTSGYEVLIRHYAD